VSFFYSPRGGPGGGRGGSPPPPPAAGSPAAVPHLVMDLGTAYMLVAAAAG
ncbi:hypothetical protein ACFXO7_37585, partial [Nocardia tengchongensis]|uniref:hypothetical protein n=1 Tax=Nocardia tengchongensis TaxID=2055889 RepID=UPI00368B3D65